MPPAEQISRQFYRQLHHSACRDIHVRRCKCVLSLCHIVLYHQSCNYIMTVYCPPTVASESISLWNCPKLLTFHSIPQSQEANWRRGHYTLTRVETGSFVWCLQYNYSKILTGHDDSTIKVGSCNITCLS